MNLETRIEKLEAQIEEKEMDVSDISLYDINGEQVNAKILRMPMDWECGLAILPDGTEREIACEGNWTDIVFMSEKILNETVENKAFKNEADYSQMLFLRRNGQISAVEMIYRANNE